MLHPEAGTIAVVDVLPDCDLCGQRGDTVAARYDAPVQGGTAWGNLCADHYVQHSTGLLGTGEGQFLLTSAEVPPEVYEALSRSLRYWSTWHP